MGHLHTFKKPKKNATNPAITISQRNTISNNVLLRLCTAMPAKLKQLEGCCCKIQQCSVSPSYNALLQKQQFAPIHHHIMLCFTICCTTIHCFVAPSYNIPYYTPLQCSFASTYNSLLHPFKMHCCTLLQCSVAPSYKSLLPHHTMPCCIMIQWSVLHNQTMHCWTIIQCSAASSFNSLLHHLTMLCCTNYNALLHLHKMYCCIITQFIVASSHCCVPTHIIQCLAVMLFTAFFLFHPSLICYNNIQCSNAQVL